MLVVRLRVLLMAISRKRKLSNNDHNAIATLNKVVELAQSSIVTNVAYGICVCY